MRAKKKRKRGNYSGHIALTITVESFTTCTDIARLREMNSNIAVNYVSHMGYTNNTHVRTVEPNNH